MRRIVKQRKHILQKEQVIEMIQNQTNRRFCYLCPAKDISDITSLYISGLISMDPESDKIHVTILNIKDLEKLRKLKNNQFRLSFSNEEKNYGFLFVLTEFDSHNQVIEIELPSIIYESVERFHPRFQNPDTNSELRIEDFSSNGICFSTSKKFKFHKHDIVRLNMGVPEIEEQDGSAQEIPYKSITIYLRVVRIWQKERYYFAGEVVESDFYAAIYLDSFIYFLHGLSDSSKKLEFPLHLYSVRLTSLLDRFRLWRHSRNR